MADAQVAFRWQFDSDLYVTNDGFILHNAQHLLTWTHHDVTAMQIIEPNRLIMQGQSDRGPLTWQLQCPYAELLFVLWALERHPDHPQLVDGSWLVPGWIDFARSQGRDPRLASGVLARPQQIRLPGQRDQPQIGPGQ